MNSSSKMPDSSFRFAEVDVFNKIAVVRLSLQQESEHGNGVFSVLCQHVRFGVWVWLLVFVSWLWQWPWIRHTLNFTEECYILPWQRLFFFQVIKVPVMTRLAGGSLWRLSWDTRRPSPPARCRASPRPHEGRLCSSTRYRHHSHEPGRSGRTGNAKHGSCWWSGP